MFTSILYYLSAVFFLLLSLFYVYAKYKYNYWRSQKVKGPIPRFPEGTFQGVFTRQKHVFKPIMDQYELFKSEPYFGMFFITNPILVINDINLIRTVLIKEFDSFNSHGMMDSVEVDPLSEHLFARNGNEWKILRSKLSPVFTIGKLKGMTDIMITTQQQLLCHIENLRSVNEIVNFKGALANYSLAIISSCGFGVECNAFEAAEPDLLKYGKEFIMPSHLKEQIGLFLALMAPKLAKLLRWSSQHKDLVEFFMNFVKNTVEYREKNQFERNDILQQLIRLMKDEIKDDNGTLLKVGSITFREMVAQTTVIFAASFETTSSSACFVLMHLAEHQEIQKKVREEIRRVLSTQKPPGTFTYEALQNLPYLDMVIEETQRLHPALSVLFRKCIQDCQLDSNLKVQKETSVYIPVSSIHYDPKYYPDPYRFDPERFSKEEKAKRPTCTYMPFGEGPRICIGMRFSAMQLRLAIAGIIHRYEVSLCEKTSTECDVSCIPNMPISMFLRTKKL